jgi:hypothetical protein
MAVSVSQTLGVPQYLSFPVTRFLDKWGVGRPTVVQVSGNAVFRPRILMVVMRRGSRPTLNAHGVGLAGVITIPSGRIAQ